MNIDCDFTAPNGMRLSFHRLERLEISWQKKVSAVVSSFASEERSSVAWQETHSLPYESLQGDALERAADFLVSQVGPLAGGKVFLPATPLEEKRASLLAELSRKKKFQDQVGCLTPKGGVETTELSVARISLALAAGAFPVQWKMAENTFEPHDREEFQFLAESVFSHLDRCLANKQKLETALKEASSLEELAAVEIDKGW